MNYYESNNLTIIWDFITLPIVETFITVVITSVITLITAVPAVVVWYIKRALEKPEAKIKNEVLEICKDAIEDELSKPTIDKERSDFICHLYSNSLKKE